MTQLTVILQSVTVLLSVWSLSLWALTQPLPLPPFHFPSNSTWPAPPDSPAAHLLLDLLFACYLFLHFASDG